MNLRFKKKVSAIFLGISILMNFSNYYATDMTSEAINNNQEYSATEDYEQMLISNSKDSEDIDFEAEQNSNRYIIKYIDPQGDKLVDSDKIVIDDSFEVITINDETTVEDMQNSNDNIEYIQPDYRLYLCEKKLSDDTSAKGDVDQVDSDTDDTSVDIAHGEDKTENINIIMIDSEGMESEITEQPIVNKNPVVAVIDTGIYIEHEALEDSIWTNSNERENNKDEDGNGFVDDTNGRDFVNNTPIHYNEKQIVYYSHGTHIAGIISGNNENIQGINSSAQIMPLKAFENGVAFTSDVIRAINYAEDMGADIVNCSFGSNERNAALEYAISNTAMIFVCAAGNNAANIDDTPFYPASYDCENIISVAAMDGNNLAFFSNYGKDIDIAVNGASAKSSTPENEYGNSCGTSVSAAYVSGVMADIIAETGNSDIKTLFNILKDMAVESNSDDPRLSGMAVLELNYTSSLMSEEYETELYTDSDDTYTTLNISQISAGGYHSAINVNNDAFIFGESNAVNGDFYWGDEDFAAPGHKMFESGYPTGDPNSFDPSSFIVKKVSTRGDHTLILLANGIVCSLGANQYGQLGVGYVNGGITDGYDPTLKVLGLTNIVDIAAGHQFSMALDSSGRVYTWGNNKDGQLGINSTYPFYTTAQLVEGLPKIKEISAGHYHALVKSVDGDIYGWGRSYNGALGEQSLDACISPVKLDVDNVDKAIAGLDNSFFIKSDKTVYACGANTYGQLGDGTLNTRTDIFKVGIDNVVDVSASFSTIFLTEDGTAYGCGANGFGQLGIGSTATAVRNIVKIPGTYTAVSTGGSHTLFLGDEGIYSAGRNQHKQCGFEDADGIYLTPTLISSFSKDAFKVTNVYVDNTNNKLVVEGTSNLYSSIDARIIIGYTYLYANSTVDNNGIYHLEYDISSLSKGRYSFIFEMYHEYPYKLRHSFSYNPLSDNVAAEYSFNIEKDKQYILGVNVENIENIKDKTFTVTVDSEFLTLDDVCAQTTKKDVSVGGVDETDINILSVSASQIKFKTNKSQANISGIINMLRFNAVANGSTTLKITAE